MAAARSFSLVSAPAPASSSRSRSSNVRQALTRAAAGADASLAIVARISQGSTFAGSRPASTLALTWSWACRGGWGTVDWALGHLWGSMELPDHTAPLSDFCEASGRARGPPVTAGEGIPLRFCYNIIAPPVERSSLTSDTVASSQPQSPVHDMIGTALCRCLGRSASHHPEAREYGGRKATMFCYTSRHACRQPRIYDQHARARWCGR